MNITLLIGNGFDRGLNLKSCFSDYFPRYIEEVSKDGLGYLLEGLPAAIEKHPEEWSDFEAMLGQYTAQFTSEKKEMFIEQLEQFEDGFIKYLSEQEKEFEANALSMEKTITEGLLGFYSEQYIRVEQSAQIKALLNKRYGEHRNYGIISFNYTKTFEKSIGFPEGIGNVQAVFNKRKHGNSELKDAITSIVHVHGTLGADVIMGVNDSSQIANEEFANDASFGNLLIKPSINQSLLMSYDSKATDLIQKSDIVFIYGMSLGVTDKKWWRLIAKWLLAKDERYLVLHQYIPNFNKTLSTRWIRKNSEIVGGFLQHADLDDAQKDTISKRIFLMTDNIFEMRAENEEQKEDTIA